MPKTTVIRDAGVLYGIEAALKGGFFVFATYIVVFCTIFAYIIKYTDIV